MVCAGTVFCLPCLLANETLRLPLLSGCRPASSFIVMNNSRKLTRQSYFSWPPYLLPLLAFMSGTDSDLNIALLSSLCFSFRASTTPGAQLRGLPLHSDSIKCSIATRTHNRASIHPQLLSTRSAPRTSQASSCPIL